MTWKKINPYFVFAVLSFASLCLVFSKTIWFDESYTLALIQHDYADMVEILKTDMHPPLYFVSLKYFCDIFGYSLLVTKIFSLLGYVATLGLGCTIVKKHFGQEISVLYMLVIGAIPMTLYFATQQRAYSWCIFFVTLCFIGALLFLRNGKVKNCALIVIAGLLAAYNHIYALLAVGVIFAFLNLYGLAKDRKLLVKILVADILVVFGYGGWLVPLLEQTASAYEKFWLTGVEIPSVIVFVVGILFCSLILANKKNRKLSIVFAIISVMGIQVIGLGVTIFIRPLYIGRYSVVVLGIFALLLAFAAQNHQKHLEQICVGLCLLCLTMFVGTAVFEYNPSFHQFQDRFEEELSASDTFLYCDSSFGIMAYYYPDHTHLRTYEVAYYAAFENVAYVDKNDIAAEVNPDGTIWLVKEAKKPIPGYIQKAFAYELIDSFVCDFHTFEVYALQTVELASFT